jgi:hypothetical protein
MARNGVGVYVPTSGTWTNGAANGVLATLADWDALLDDLVEALSQSLAKDGQTVLTGNLQMGGFKLTGMGNATGIGQPLSFEQLFSQGTETDLASTATTDIGTPNTNFLRITGTTTITSFGTNYRGPRFLRFADAVTLTNSSSLVITGGANITTTAGEIYIAIPKATAGVADGWYVVSSKVLYSPKLIAPESTGAIYDNGSVRSNIVAVAALNIDCSTGNFFTKTIAGNSTFTFSNAPASTAYAFTLELTHTSGTVTWPASVQWPGGTAPTFQNAKTSLFVFVTDDGGARWRGISNTNYTT